MVVNKQLQKQIFIEIIALSVLVIAIVYGMFAIGNNSNKVLSEEGMVLVLDDSSFKSINSSSDGVGIESEGIKYTVTNNNLDEVSYKLIIKVNEKKELLKYIRVSTEEQSRAGFSLQEQEKRLWAMCEYKGYEVYKIYKDAGKKLLQLLVNIL